MVISNKLINFRNLLSTREQLVSLLSQCTTQRNVSQARSLYKAILHSEHRHSVFLLNLVVQMFGKCGCVSDAKAAFHGIHNTNIYSWNILLQAYSNNGYVHQAWEIFQEMRERDLVTWNAMATAYTQLRHMPEAVAMLEKFPRWNVICWSALVSGFAEVNDIHSAWFYFHKADSRNDVTWNALVQAYAANGDFHLAKLAFDRMPNWSVISWNVLYQAFAQHGDLENARELFLRMPERNIMSWNGMLGAYTQHGYIDQAMEIFREMPERNAAAWNTLIATHGVDLSKRAFDRMPSWDVISWNSLLAAYVHRGYMDEAVCLCEAMPERNSFTWSLMIDVYSQGGALSEAKRAFDSMPNRDVVSWNTLLAANSQNGCLEALKELFSRMPSHDVVAWTSLTSAFAQQGRMDEARHTFELLPCRNVVSWNAIIQGYTQNGHSLEALTIYHEMELAGVKPDEASFKSVLAACSHVGKLQECWRKFHTMLTDHGLTPQPEHYNCMVDLLGRSGQLDRAEELIRSMPFPESAMAWSTLLGSCKLHKDVERAARVAENVFRLGPDDPAPYILLANVYASVGRMQDMAAVRRRMESSGVRKLAGCSTIEIDGKLHRFIAGDSSHPRRAEILSELQRLEVDLREKLGYVPDTGDVLHDVKDLEKESLVRTHSERLAVGLGLISLQPGSPVRILKNLRVCPDCHTFIKLASKASGRSFIVRDAVRFHSFQNGECSCGDYW